MPITEHSRMIAASAMVLSTIALCLPVAAQSSESIDQMGTAGIAPHPTCATPTPDHPVILVDAFDGEKVTSLNEGDPLSPDNLVFIHAHRTAKDMRPIMPELELHISNTLAGDVKARLEVEYPRGNGARPSRGTEYDEVKIPADGEFRIIESDEWKIHKDPDFLAEVVQNGFFGGDAVVTYKLPGEGALNTIRFRIGGENPDDLKCKEFIQSFPESSPGQKLEFMYAIARHESKAKNRDRVYYNQFLHLGTHPKDGGFPAWNNDGGLTPGGYGVFQVTGTAEDAQEDIHRDEIWNWQSNVRAAFRIMTHQFKGSLAKRYFEHIKDEIPRGDLLFRQCPPPRISTAGETFSARQAVWITAYNGWGGPIKNRFIFSEDKPCGLGEGKRWEWAPPVKPNGKTYLRLVAEEMDD